MSSIRTRLRIMSWRRLGRTTDVEADSSISDVCRSLLDFIRRTRSHSCLSGLPLSACRLPVSVFVYTLVVASGLENLEESSQAIREGQGFVQRSQKVQGHVTVIEHWIS